MKKNHLYAATVFVFIAGFIPKMIYAQDSFCDKEERITIFAAVDLEDSNTYGLMAMVLGGLTFFLLKKENDD